MPEVKCHYEVLGVPRDVEDDGLKKAYRKLALKWHPDKNPDNIEECTKYFALIQTAYGVLSDKQERAWYDKHREAILRGGFGKDYEDNFMDIMQYMTPTAYNGFGDDDKSYYSVYRDVFAKIADEDIRYMEDAEIDNDIPGFGDSQSSYEEVVHAFYAFWQSYCTSRSFVWVEEFDTREAPNRRVARLIEKDNKKKREAARKEWNQQVQLLVSYVKKKDKRLQVHRKLMEEKAAERKRLEAERRARERKERARMHEELAEEGQKVKEEMEAELRAMEETLKKEYGVDSDDLDSDSQADSLEDELDDLFCVACNKSFKSPKAFVNHENSKKHKENMTYLKAQMEAEEEEFAGEESLEEEEEEEEDLEEGDEEKEENEDDEEVELKDDDVDDEDLDEMEMEGQAKENGSEPQRKKLSKKQKKKRRHQAKLDESENALEEEEEEEKDILQPSDDQDDDFPVQTKLSKKQKKKRRQQMKAEEAEPEPDILKDLDRESGEEDFTGTKLSKKQKKRRRQQRQMAGNEEEEEKDVEDLLEKLETKSKPVPNDTRPEDKAEDKAEEPSLSADLQERLTLEDEPEEASSIPRPSSGNVKGKTKSGDAPSSSRSPSSTEPQICHTCSSRFPTRNKLFKHVKSTGHALRLQDDGSAAHHHNSSSAKSSKKKKKHKGRNELE